MWNPAFFGIKPNMVIKGGMITAANMGDANASIPTVQPMIYKHMFGALGKAKYDTCITFVSKASLVDGIKEKLGLQKRLEAVKGCRDIGKADMKFNDATPEITVDPETYVVKVDGVVATCEIATALPLTQIYNLF